MSIYTFCSAEIWKSRKKQTWRCKMKDLWLFRWTKTILQAMLLVCNNSLCPLYCRQGSCSFFTIHHYCTSTYNQTSFLWTPQFNNLTIIAWVHIRYEMVECAELAIIISYSTSASGIINCFIKNAHKIISRILSDFIYIQFLACL